MIEILSHRMFPALGAPHTRDCGDFGPEPTFFSLVDNDLELHSRLPRPLWYQREPARATLKKGHLYGSQDPNRASPPRLGLPAASHPQLGPLRLGAPRRFRA